MIVKYARAEAYVTDKRSVGVPACVVMIAKYACAEAYVTDKTATPVRHPLLLPRRSRSQLKWS